MRERISSSEYSELTDAYNSLFGGSPIDEPELVKQGLILSTILGKEFKSSREKTVNWIERNTPGSVPSEFTAYKRSEGVSEKRHRMLNPLGKIGLDSHTFTIDSGPAMGADYQIQTAFNQTLVVDLDTMHARQMEVGLLRAKDPIAVFCESALAHIEDMKSRF